MSVCLSVLAGSATGLDECPHPDLVPLLDSDLSQRAGVVGPATGQRRTGLSETGQLFGVGSGLEARSATAGPTTPHRLGRVVAENRASVESPSPGVVRPPASGILLVGLPERMGYRRVV